MDRKLRAYEDAVISVTSKGKTWTADVYSKEGCDLVNTIALKQGAEFKAMYKPTWLGVRVIQFPNDLVALQQLVWNVKPTKIIECGVAHGGQLVFLASILQNINEPKSRVIGVDVEIRQHNREIIEAHSLSNFITLIEGSSIEDSTFDKVRSCISPEDRVLVVLDSNHTYGHVKEEIRIYNKLVSAGSYLVVMDAALGYVGDIPRGEEYWFDDNPIDAIEEFLADNKEYILEPIFDEYGVTSSPYGALKKVG